MFDSQLWECLISYVLHEGLLNAHQFLKDSMYHSEIIVSRFGYMHNDWSE